ncbi:MAG: hypothetical protein HYT93_02370 [Parcubacteria group bacterium]|nr:hypothetical protein [Parcubacteria group bacterium]
MPSQASQNFVPIKEIRNGIVALKDGSLRIVLMASSLNFALKSEEEQQAVIFQFQNFLNSLDFSVQFFIQSRELDIRPYIALLEEREKEQTSELMKIQVTEYIEFIKKFTENVNIMTKTFFIVIPYVRPLLEKNKGILGAFPSKKKKTREEELESFEENRTQLEQRASIVEQGLSRTGIRVAQLGTEELVELYFKIFNPGEQEKPIVPEQVRS